MGFMLKLALLGYFVSLADATIENHVFDLPSFTLDLSVKELDTSHRIMQDKLEKKLQEHLIDFYKAKLETSDNDEVTVHNVIITSDYYWTQHTDYHEMNGVHDSQIKVAVASTQTSINEPLMELYFAEAFQGDYYWHLVHNFLIDEILSDVYDVKIMVDTDRYGHYSDIEDDFEKKNVMNGGTIAGLFLLGLFCIALVLLGIYIYSWIQVQRENKSRASHTDNDSDEEDFEDDDVSTGSWMDLWAKAVTSIPLRDPNLQRKKRPRYHQQPPKFRKTECKTTLDCITEGEDEDASLASGASGGSKASILSGRFRSLLRSFSEDEEKSVPSIPEGEVIDCCSMSSSDSSLYTSPSQVSALTALSSINEEEEGVELKLPDELLSYLPKSFMLSRVEEPKASSPKSKSKSKSKLEPKESSKGKKKRKKKKTKP